MKPLSIFLKFLILLGLFSCEKNDVNTKTYSEYLSDKIIVSIRIFNNDIWVQSTKRCDTCYRPPMMSSIPMISQLTLIRDSIYRYEEPTLYSVPTSDHHGNLYVGLQNKIYKVNDIHDYTLYLETGNFSFNYFAFDKDDNIWFGGYNGIAFWNGTELKVYNTSNSLLPSDITHGLAIDKDGIVWIALDFKGLLKITGDLWEIIPNNEIPGLNTYSYLHNPMVDNENNIWFNAFSSDATSSILKPLRVPI